MKEIPEYLNDYLLIQSPFVETTRKGKRLSSVTIALTSRALTINLYSQTHYVVKETSQFYSCYPLETTKLEIFKKSHRQCIKVSSNTHDTKYFELEQWKNREIFWKRWCFHVKELKGPHRKWPFVSFQQDPDQHCKQESVNENNVLRWTDKYLYLGTIRANEDNNRPKPVPGLGPTEDIKLFYLKPKYFGCWDQSEHWVQCGNSTSSFNG